MLHSGQGDDGKTKIFGCDQRLSKSSLVAEALGSVDEINSWLGLCKVKTKDFNGSLEISGLSLERIIEELQNSLFSVQAELAGADKKVSPEEVVKMESWLKAIEAELPPIKSFLIAGGTELSALFDFSRTVARRAERMVVRVSDTGEVKLEKDTTAFMNRLSSLLYGLARLANHRAGIEEKKPEYR